MNKNTALIMPPIAVMMLGIMVAAFRGRTTATVPHKLTSEITVTKARVQRSRTRLRGKF